MIIGGGYEFAHPGTETDRHPGTVARLKRAFEMLDYDIFFLSPADATVLSSTGIAPADGWRQSSEEPGLIVRDVPGGRLAFVLFPDSGQDDPAAGEELERYARALRDKGLYNLIIGLSTWGAARERAFIESREPVFDIVFGSGTGPGYAGLYLQDNKVLLVRAFTKGKSLMSVALPVLPPVGDKIVWTPETTVKAISAPLGDGLASDPEIEAIFGP